MGEEWGWLSVTICSVLGAIVGSFIGTLVQRLPQGRDIVRAPSACDHCGRRLHGLELVPVLAWLALRGRCRTCGGALDRWQLVSEILGAGVGAGAALMPLPERLPAMALGWQLLALGLLDARCFWLPRGLSLALGASGLALSAWFEFGPKSGLASGFASGFASGPAFGSRGESLLTGSVFAGSALGCVVGYALLAVPAWAYQKCRGREGLGGGDPFLLGAIGAWAGVVGVVVIMLAASLLGLLLAIIWALSGRRVEASTILPLGSLMAVAAWPTCLGLAMLQLRAW